MAYCAGVDVGSVSINCIVIDEQQQVVYEAPYIRHFGLAHEEVQRVISDIYDRFGRENIRSIAFTGMHGQLLSEILSAPHEVETIAQVLGATHVVPQVRTIISVGGQDASLFQVEYNSGQWHLESFNMNGPCASGTGSFIDQQAERLALSMYGSDFDVSQEKLQGILKDFIALGLQSTDVAPVACRCTVFTKSDMIHLQNKGEPLPNIIAGLHYGNAANYMSTIVANRELFEPIIFVGGMASNELQVKAFRHYYPNLQVPLHHTSLGALGAALQALKQGWANMVDVEKLNRGAHGSSNGFPRAGRLELVLTHFDPDNSLPPRAARPKSITWAYLGVDVGSTSTKYALIDEEGNIIHKCYVPTQGRPIEVAQKLLGVLLKETGKNVMISAVATTGSGRNVVGDFLSADLIIDEITAHARGAVAVDPNVDTIFEIGGQDSKYIHIERTHPLDFDMNKVCAAGTGSFLHELANKMKINIVGEFQEIALSAQDPIHLAERCTVFMESDLVSCAQKGAKRQDLIGGLCYAIVYNYLNRVVEKRYIGQRVMFLGGPSLNRGIVAAFEKVLGRALIVPKHREVLGAFGAALAVRELAQKGQLPQRSRDLAELTRSEVGFTETVCRADKKCHNECKLKVYNFGVRKSIWGGECGRYEVSRYEGPKQKNLFLERQTLFLEAVEEAGSLMGEFTPRNESSTPTVGIPLALHTLDLGIFWTHLFARLGFNVLVSPRTNNRIVLGGVECMTSETCFPVKVFHGHVRYLLDEVDYLFLPNAINVPTPQPNERGYFCPYVAASQYMVRAALRLPDRKLIRPSVHMKDGPRTLAGPIRESLPEHLRPGWPKVERAIEEAWERQELFRTALRRRGQEILRQLGPDEPLWIITGRPYNLHDERLNLQLGRHLAKLGIKAMPLGYLDLDSEDLSDFPRMYWGLGARILRAAKQIARTPNWYGVHLTNFSCGADSFIEHFYRHILQDKPSLILELDEHSAVAGLLTRIEAYQNVVKNLQERHSASNGEPEVQLEVSC